MQESRLFKIVYYLLDKGKATAPELSEKFEVSIRTIYRDIDVISSAGIPIYATQGKGGGIAILEDFVLDKSILSTQEKEQILMALQGIIATDKNNSGELLSKLESLFQAKNTNWIEIDFSNWIQRDTEHNIFNSIKEAIFKKNTIFIQYVGNNRKITQRKVAPLKLVFKSKDWYLYGYCLLRNDYRFFKLSRIKDIEVLSDIYSHEITIPSVVVKQIGSESTIPVFLKFEKEVAFRVYDEFTEDVTEDEQGNLYVKANLPNNDMLYSYVLSFGNYVEILGPFEIRERIKKNLSNMLKKYET